MKKFIFIAAIFTFFFVSPSAFACEPCANILSFEETLSRTDLIIVGQKVADGPRSDFGEGYGGSDWIEVKVVETLKGSTPNTKIKVNSWDAMCSYGIIINDNRNYLMLLQKRVTSEEDYQYDAVNFGCAEKSYLVENNQINLEGRKISLEALVSKYGLQVQIKDSNKDYIQIQDSTDDITQEQSLTLYYIIFGLIILTIVVFVLLKIVRKRK